jgi:hypothetical protein
MQSTNLAPDDLLAEVIEVIADGLPDDDAQALEDA